MLKNVHTEIESSSLCISFNYIINYSLRVQIKHNSKINYAHSIMCLYVKLIHTSTQLTIYRNGYKPSGYSVQLMVEFSKIIKFIIN